MGCAYSSPRDEAPLRRSVPDSVSGGRLCECPSAKGPRGTQPSVDGTSSQAGAPWRHEEGAV